MKALHRQRGLSIVELMVGLAVGLVVAAAAIGALAQQVGSTRRLLLDARLTHELAATAELMARHLRRAHHWRGAAEAVWQPGAATRPNPHALSFDSPEQVSFTYSTPATDGPAAVPEGDAAAPDGWAAANEHFGFRLRDGRVDMQLGQGRWQALTDPSALRVTALQIQPVVHEIPLAHRCAVECDAATRACPPRLQLRTVSLQLAAHSVGDASLTRRLQQYLRLRNDTVSGECSS
ncbi:prepilin-type N-terminal cleavage/methylation domain-containing protein [Rhizobacter sp. LjRoot28]|uniref:prepilin-type N-terminal cleavage/methylation domain-containing protein n=1 Tax=Rhizobacter sp. LjRoot28 TaxID=3342309 RepID=UPI003ECEA55F